MTEPREVVPAIDYSTYMRDGMKIFTWRDLVFEKIHRWLGEVGPRILSADQY